MLEKDLQRFAEKICALYKIHFAHIPNTSMVRLNHKIFWASVSAGSAWKNNGWPDLICIGPEGRLLLMELKTEKGRLSDCQVQFKKYCDDNGHSYIICRSTEEIEAAVKALAGGLTMTPKTLTAEIDDIDRQLEIHRKAAQELEERREALVSQLKIIRIQKGVEANG